MSATAPQHRRDAAAHPYGPCHLPPAAALQTRAHCRLQSTPHAQVEIHVVQDDHPAPSCESHLFLQVSANINYSPCSTLLHHRSPYDLIGTVHCQTNPKSPSCLRNLNEVRPQVCFQLPEASKASTTVGAFVGTSCGDAFPSSMSMAVPSANKMPFGLGASKSQQLKYLYANHNKQLLLHPATHLAIRRQGSEKLPRPQIRPHHPRASALLFQSVSCTNIHFLTDSAHASRVYKIDKSRSLTVLQRTSSPQ